VKKDRGIFVPSGGAPARKATMTEWKVLQNGQIAD
jgi:hypothetical protein